MRILYVAPGTPVPGSHGGSTHTLEVARGLSSFGDKVFLVSKRESFGQEKKETLAGIEINRVLPVIPRKLLEWLALPSIYRLAKKIKPDVILERYYNFGGGGIITGTLLKIPSVVEVISPVVDHPGSIKGIIDRLLIIRPMKRYREWLLRKSEAIISPIREILPEKLPETKIHLLHTGANLAMFSPEGYRKEKERRKLGIDKDQVVVTFLGSFRRWHGVLDFIEAGKKVLSSGKKEAFFLMVGSGPLYRKGRELVSKSPFRDNFIFLGSVPYDDVPSLLSASDIGVAPFNSKGFPSLKLGFYWSPLKVFEYLAMGLPVITIDIPPLNEMVRDNEEGLLYPEGDIPALADKISYLIENKEDRRRMGESARARSPIFSWESQTKKIAGILKKVVKDANTDNH
jgi:starch synthase